MPTIDRAQAWMRRWMEHPELRPTHDEGEQPPARYGYRIPEDGTIQFHATFTRDGRPHEVTVTRRASDLGLRITPEGGLAPIPADTATTATVAAPTQDDAQ